jgi:methionyl-tRNA formyltransferase
MRVFLFLNNWGGWQVARWLRARGDTIVGASLQPADERRFGPAMLDTLKLPADRIWLSTELREPKTVAQIRDLAPDIGVSAFFGIILKPELLGVFPKGCINLHSAMLPYNRGWHTNVWPIIDGTPAGYTVHYIDDGVDTGDIIAQRRVPVASTDTGGDLHERITRGVVDLFKEVWPDIRAGTNTRTVQDHARATIHRKAEISGLSRIDLARRYRARDLINILRARTYPPYPSAFYMEGDNPVHVRLELTPDAAGVTRATALPWIDLDAQYSAEELLSLLGAHDLSSEYVAAFADDAGPVLARARIVDARDFDTRASPAWMAV